MKKKKENLTKKGGNFVQPIVTSSDYAYAILDSNLNIEWVTNDWRKAYNYVRTWNRKQEEMEDMLSLKQVDVLK